MSGRDHRFHWHSKGKNTLERSVKILWWKRNLVCALKDGQELDGGVGWWGGDCSVTEGQKRKV